MEGNPFTREIILPKLPPKNTPKLNTHGCFWDQRTSFLSLLHPQSPERVFRKAARLGFSSKPAIVVDSKLNNYYNSPMSRVLSLINLIVLINGSEADVGEAPR